MPPFGKSLHLFIAGKKKKKKRTIFQELNQNLRLGQKRPLGKLEKCINTWRITRCGLAVEKNR